MFRTSELRTFTRYSACKSGLNYQEYDPGLDAVENKSRFPDLSLKIPKSHSFVN